MRCAVLGGCGFVGRAFVKRLLAERGFTLVEIIDDLSTGLHPDTWLPNTTDWTFSHCDVRSFFKLVPAGRYELIIHCAAVVGGRKKIEGDPLAVATDLSIDSDLFNWCVRGAKPRKVIYFSSSAVYPISLQQQFCHENLREDHVDLVAGSIGMPDETYGWSKLTGELLARHAARKYGLDVVIYRPFSGYGQDQDFTYPFPTIIQRVVKREHPIVVWGSSNQVRDFIHISDVVEGVLSTMHELRAGEVMNLGTGRATSMRHLVEIACGILNHKTVVCPQPEHPEGVYYRVADTSKMFRYFTPKVTLEQGILWTAHHMMLDTKTASV